LLGLFGNCRLTSADEADHQWFGVPGVTDHSGVFLSYSRHDGEAAINLRGQLQRRGLNVFKDDERIRAGELWLDRLQEAVGLGALVVLVAHFGYD
jgi:TIR domain